MRQSTEMEGNKVSESTTNRYLVFSILKQDYALPIQYIMEIIDLVPITKVPSLPPYVKGIINVHGSIFPVMDVRMRFDFEPMEYNERTCIIMVENNGVSVGLIVDSVQEVVSIPDEEIALPADGDLLSNTKYITGVGHLGDSTQLILDCDALMNVAG